MRTRRATPVRIASLVGATWILVGIACGTKTDQTAAPLTAPAITPDSPELRISTFDVAEPGWGDAPVAVHFVWSIASTAGKPLTCFLDVDGDGAPDQRIEGCRGDTLAAPLDALPTHVYTAVGEHTPKLVVTDGEHTVEATQKVYANHLTFAKNVIFPEKTPGFVKAEAVPNTSVVLTFASDAQVPDVKAGDILWGTSGIGYLIKAIEVTKAGATLSITGEQGMLGEAIENGFLGARDVYPTYDDARCLDDVCKDAVLEKVQMPAQTPLSLAPRSTGTHSDRLSGSGELAIKIPLPSLGEQFEHSITCKWGLRTFVLEVGFFEIKKLDIDFLGSFAYDLSFKGDIAKKKLALGTFTLGTIPVGPVPIVPIVFPTLGIGATLKFSTSVGVALPLRATYTPETGTHLDFGPTAFGTLKDMLSPNGVGITLEATGSLSFPVTAAILGIGGPYVSPVLGASGALTIGTPPSNDNPCNAIVQACASVKGTFGGEVGIGMPWIKDADLSAEITLGEKKFYDKCTDRDVSDPTKCADGGVTLPDSGTDSGTTLPDGGLDAGPNDDGGDGGGVTVPQSVQDLAARWGIPVPVLIAGYRPLAIAQIIHSSASVPPKPVAGDHTTIDGQYADKVTLDQTTINGFACGAGPGPGAFTVCPPGGAPLSPGPTIAIIDSLAGAIPFNDTGNIYQYGFVFDGNGNPSDNYVPSPQFPNDFFGGTDLWFEANRTAAGAWSLKGTSAAGGTQTPATTSAHIFISGKAIGLLVPVSELSSATPPFRVTAFRHTGDYGMNPPYDYDGSLWPAVADGLEPFPPP